MNTIDAYDLLSLFYDEWQQELDQNKRTSYLERLIKIHRDSCFQRKKTMEQLLCDLGCGTGKTSVSFAQKGYSVVGIDLSELMLNVAAQAAVAENVSVIFSQQNICTFSLPESASVVLCLMDTVNHLTTKKDLCRFFKRVYCEILVGGVFIFDFVSPFYFQKILSDKVFYFEDQNKAIFWQNYYAEKKKMNYAEITMFVREESGLYIRNELEIRERSYSLEEMQDALALCGFSICGVYGDLSMKEPKEDEQRIFVVAKKV